MKQVFSEKRVIQLSDVNFGKHLDFAKLVSIIGDSRANLFKSRNIEEINEAGIGIITSNVSVKYISQVRYGDTITIKFFLDYIKKVRFGFNIEVFKESTLTAKSSLELATIDYRTEKPCKIPEYILSPLNN